VITERLISIALALAFKASADLQLMQMPVEHLAHDMPAAQLQDCHTSAEGDACFNEVLWAMQTGVVEHPEWYPSLTDYSNFEDFQLFLHGDARLSGVCPRPCGARAPEAPAPAGPSAPEACRTSAEGDACFEKVLWAMRTGVVEHPDWYSPLTSSSSFEEFQRHLHGVARLSGECPEPCPAQAPGCHTSVEGDLCFNEVLWAMDTGVVEHPDWYSPLTSSSSLEEFQRFLHGDARLSHVCPEPCAARASEVPQSPRLPLLEEEDEEVWYWVDDGCHTEHDRHPVDYVGAYLQGTQDGAFARCCAGDGSSCTSPQNCLKGQPGTYAAASAVCHGLGLRLCTKDELISEVCCDTGGLCDNSPVWTSSAYTPVVQTSSATSSPVLRAPAPASATYVVGGGYTKTRGGSAEASCGAAGLQDITTLEECQSAAEHVGIAIKKMVGPGDWDHIPYGCTVQQGSATPESGAVGTNGMVHFSTTSGHNNGGLGGYVLICKR